MVTLAQAGIQPAAPAFDTKKRLRNTEQHRNTCGRAEGPIGAAAPGRALPNQATPAPQNPADLRHDDLRRSRKTLLPLVAGILPGRTRNPKFVVQGGQTPGGNLAVKNNNWR